MLRRVRVQPVGSAAAIATLAAAGPARARSLDVSSTKTRTPPVVERIDARGLPARG